MGLFDKKFCSICEEKIGLLGNRKLEDGNLCKDCARKLSPFFSERRHSTIEDIRQQLEYRENNKHEVALFHQTQVVGEKKKLIIDYSGKKFVVVDSYDNWKDSNPDVISFDMITGMDSDIKTDHRELKHQDSNGKMVSYNPPRYSYEYDFDIKIYVNHPYFDEIPIRLNSSSVKEEQTGNGNSLNHGMEFQKYKRIYEEMEFNINKMRQIAAQRPTVSTGNSSLSAEEEAIQAIVNNPNLSKEEKLLELAKLPYAGAMSAALRLGSGGAGMGMSAVATATGAPTPAPAPAGKVICACCGATTMPDATGACEYCGGPVKG